jgi:DNA-binding CsgD family transcriptional regulator
LGSVLDTTLGFLGSVADGEPTEHALCTCLAYQFHATAAAHIAFDLHTSIATMTAWPHTVDILRLRVVLERLPQVFPLLLHHVVVDRRASCLSADADPDTWRGTVAALVVQEVLGCEDLAQVPLNPSGSPVRLAVLASRQAFHPQDMHVLACLQEPLAMLTRVAERRTEPGPTLVAPAANGGELEDPRLTAREIEVLRMVAQGLLARTIAARLDVSPRTVHKHLANVYRKLDAHDRLIAVRRAESLGLLSARRLLEPDDRTGVLTLRW